MLRFRGGSCFFGVGFVVFSAWGGGFPCFGAGGVLFLFLWVWGFFSLGVGCLRAVLFCFLFGVGGASFLLCRPQICEVTHLIINLPLVVFVARKFVLFLYNGMPCEQCSGERERGSFFAQKHARQKMGDGRVGNAWCPCGRHHRAVIHEAAFPHGTSNSADDGVRGSAGASSASSPSCELQEECEIFKTAQQRGFRRTLGPTPAPKSGLALSRIRHFANKDLQASQKSAAVQRVVVSTVSTTGGSRIGVRRESLACVTTAALADRADIVNPLREAAHWRTTSRGR